SDSKGSMPTLPTVAKNDAGIQKVYRRSRGLSRLIHARVTRAGDTRPIQSPLGRKTKYEPARHQSPRVPILSAAPVARERAQRLARLVAEHGDRAGRTLRRRRGAGCIPGRTDGRAAGCAADGMMMALHTFFSA